MVVLGTDTSVEGNSSPPYMKTLIPNEKNTYYEGKVIRATNKSAHNKNRPQLILRRNVCGYCLHLRINWTGYLC